MSHSDEPLPLKVLVNFLFEHVLHPEGRPYTSQEVSDQVRISHATINQLRTGRNKNPTLPTLQDICRFFGVPLSFFECRSEEECLAVLAEQRRDESPKVAEIAFRASALSPKGQDNILEVISWVEAVERAQQEHGGESEFPDSEE